MARLTHERRLQALTLGALLPALGVGALLLGYPIPQWAGWALCVGSGAWGTWMSWRLLQEARRPLQTLSNLLAALREGDYSVRGREQGRDDALGHVFAELNSLSELLSQQRLRTLEATALLRSVMETIEVAIFAFDDAGLLRLANPAGAGLLGRSPEGLQGGRADLLGLGPCLEGKPLRLVDLALPGRSGRFELRRGVFRQGGRPHQLLVLSDLTRTLREEERQAWQRLLRVLGHEINNSLAPIQSLAESLVRIVEQQRKDWLEDTRQGLGIIAGRSQALSRFMEATTRLAKLPEPRRATVDLGPLLRKVAALERRLDIRVEAGPELVLEVDADQLEQALINLLKNAVEAALAEGGGVQIGWSTTPHALEIWVEDEGPGLPSEANLFVPFFTTKAGGSGIGLVLARQIAEGHGGSLLLRNREGGRGARALLRLPLE